MTTTKSYSDRSRFAAVYRASLKQQLPIGIVSLIFFFLLIPLPFLVDQMYRTDPPFFGGVTVDIAIPWRAHFTGVYLDGGQAMFAVALLMVMGVVVALVQTAHMHSRKMTDLYHAIPVKRPQLLTANSLASLTLIFAPFLALTLVTMLVELIMYGKYLAGFGWYFQYIAIDLAGGLIALLAVYAFTVFIATMVGTVFDSFALTGVLGFTPLLLFFIIVMLWNSLTYGSTTAVLEEAILWLSPFTAPFLRFTYLTDYYNAVNGAVVSRESVLAASGIPDTLGMMGIWLGIAAVLYCAAILCYNRRKSELCEQTQPQGVLQTIAKCFAGFAGAALFYVIFSDINNAFTMILSSVFGAVLIGLIAELILSRGVRSLKKNIVWLAGSGLLFAAVIFCIRADLIGYVNRVPDAGEVQSVSVNYRGRSEQMTDRYQLYDGGYASIVDGGYDPNETVLTDPASIELITAMHRLTVDNPPVRTNGYSGYFAHDDEHSGYVSIEYTLKNGRAMQRSYSPVYHDAYRMLSELETNEEFIRQNNAVFLIDALYGEGAAAEAMTTVTLTDAISSGDQRYLPTPEEAARIVEAVRLDMLAEPLEELKNPSAPAFGYLQMEFELERYADYQNYEMHTAGAVLLSAGYTRTIGVLRELGMWADPVMPEIDEIRFYHATQIGFTENQVFTLPPNRVEDVQYWNDYGYYTGEDDEGVPLPAVNAPADIEKVLSVARNQLMGENREISVAAYYKDGVFLGGQLVRFGDLPENAKEEIALQYGAPEETGENVAVDSGGPPILPERVAAAAALQTRRLVRDMIEVRF